jgi:glycosyltransferase
VKSPKLSVVTVVRNDRHGLERTVVSVREQELLDIEHIVVDGSDTPDHAFLDYLSASGTKVVKGIGGGPYRAMSCGAELAEGAALSFLNAGDVYVAPTSATTLASLIASSSWGYGSLKVLNASGRDRVYAFRPFRKWELACGLKYVPHPSSVVRTDLFHKYQGFDLSYQVAADQKFFLQLAQEHRPCVSREVIAVFNMGGASSRAAICGAQDFERMRREVHGPIARSTIADRSITHGSALVRHAGRWVRERRGRSDFD